MHSITCNVKSKTIDFKYNIIVNWLQYTLTREFKMTSKQKIKQNIQQSPKSGEKKKTNKKRKKLQRQNAENEN